MSDISKQEERQFGCGQCLQFYRYPCWAKKCYFRHSKDCLTTIVIRFVTSPTNIMRTVIARKCFYSRPSKMLCLSFNPNYSSDNMTNGNQTDYVKVEKEFSIDSQIEERADCGSLEKPMHTVIARKCFYSRPSKTLRLSFNPNYSSANMTNGDQTNNVEVKKEFSIDSQIEELGDCGSLEIEELGDCESLEKPMLSCTEKKHFKCMLCDVAYSNKHHLKRHLFIHTGLRPFRCEVCDVSFSQRSYLKRHMLTHGGERQFKCKECPATFCRKFHLQRHLYTHADNRPYKCESCTAQFTELWNLKKHMLSHTNKWSCSCVNIYGEHVWWIMYVILDYWQNLSS